jgi:hypothetical protein
VTPEGLFIIWQTGVLCSLVAIAGLPLEGEFSYRGRPASPRGNTAILILLAYLWFVSIPVFTLLGTWTRTKV